jgi:hypothetical protein
VTENKTKLIGKPSRSLYVELSTAVSQRKIAKMSEGRRRGR